MRILADENVPRVVVEALRRLRHDVDWALEDAPGAPDASILTVATRERSLLLTLDKDLADRAARRRVSVVLVRARGAGPVVLARVVSSAIESRKDWFGHRATIEPDRIRMRALEADPRRRSQKR